MIDLKEIFQTYKGKWVAIEGKNNVVASGNNPVSVHNEAVGKNYKHVSLFYVPKRSGSFVGVTV